ncbi:MAG: hypothetical protein ABJA84_01995 [Polaromonas sp.]
MSCTPHQPAQWRTGVPAMIDWSKLETATDKAAKAVAQQREAAKAERAQAVQAITVTTAAGNTFDGDETSQTRMARAIVALLARPAGETTLWVLSDNTVLQASAQELTEALQLAGRAQTDLWAL